MYTLIRGTYTFPGDTLLNRMEEAIQHVPSKEGKISRAWKTRVSSCSFVMVVTTGVDDVYLQMNRPGLFGSGVST